MGKPITLHPLDARLEKTAGQGVLCSNPKKSPFWVPEENPLLRTWDMTVDEYWRTARKVTGLRLEEACRPALKASWPELDGESWNVGLIALLGRAYRLTHPDWESGPEDGGDGLDYVPHSERLESRLRWRSGGELADTGSLTSWEELDKALKKLILAPFSGRQRTDETARNARKG